MSPSLAAVLTSAALVAIGLGCGPQEASDPVATPLAESKTARNRPPSPHGNAYVEYSDGRVTVRSNGSLQLAVLEQLAAQVGFEIIAGKTNAQPITLHIERASLVDAIALILDGYSYALEYEFGEASETRILTRVEIGDTLENSAVDFSKTAPTDPLRIGDLELNTAARPEKHGRSGRMTPRSEEDAAEQAELLSRLDSSDPDERIDAADWIDLDEEALARMISLLESDPDPEVRMAIAERLGDEESPAAMAALIAALRDPNSEVVLQIIEFLEFEAGAWLIPELQPLLAHHDLEVREAAEYAIDFLEE